MLRVLTILVLSVSLAACNAGRESFGALAGGNTLLLDFTQEDFLSNPFAEEVIVVLHSEDGRRIEREIDLRQTKGIADFGALNRDRASVSLLSREQNGYSFVITYADLPLGHYRPIDACSDAVSVNLDVDLSAATGGGAHAADATGFAGDAVTAGQMYWETPQQPKQSDMEIRDLSVCPGSDARVFAAAYVDARPDAWVLENIPNVQAGGRYTVAVNQASQAVPVAAMDPMPDSISMHTLLDGQWRGSSDWLWQPEAGDQLFGALSAPGVSVALTALHEDEDTYSYLWQREAQAATLRQVRLTPWRADGLRLLGVNEDGSGVAYSYRSSVEMQIASTHFPLTGPGAETGDWYIFAAAQSDGGEIPLPSLPTPEEDWVPRESFDQHLSMLRLFGSNPVEAYREAVNQWLFSGNRWMTAEKSFIATQYMIPDRSAESSLHGSPKSLEGKSNCLVSDVLCRPEQRSAR